MRRAAVLGGRGTYALIALSPRRLAASTRWLPSRMTSLGLGRNCGGRLLAQSQSYPRTMGGKGVGRSAYSLESTGL